MMNVYLDNAATTPMAPEVCDAMYEVMKEQFGNPSSSHAFGRKVKAILEGSRRSIAGYINANPAEIIFTSGGTEADNLALVAAVKDLGAKHIVTSPLEHHAVGHTVEILKKEHDIKLSYVKLLDDGCVDLEDIENLLSANEKTIVSLMHANNEIGNLLPLKEVSEMCKKYDALFHSDTVQTMGHYTFDVVDLGIDFLTCSAHKFHGPKGVGFLYMNRKHKITPLIHGGGQERSLRAGTENISGIVGLNKAMELAYSDLEEHHEHIQSLKDHMISELTNQLDGCDFNGACKVGEKSLYTVLNVKLPETEKAGMLLFQLDLRGVAASGGSACSSGAQLGSHVLRSISKESAANRPSVRFSFGRYTTKEEIDHAVASVVDIYNS